jgi:hypothetical protein
MKSKKRDDILEVVEKLEFPEVKIIHKHELVNREIIFRYN